MDYINEEFRFRMGIYMDGAKLEQLMIDVGFIDVLAKKVKLEIGTWGASSPISNDLILIVDPQLGRKVLEVCGGAFEGLADTLVEQYPDDEEREEFKHAMISDLSNPEFRLFIWV